MAQTPPWSALFNAIAGSTQTYITPPTNFTSSYQSQSVAGGTHSWTSQSTYYMQSFQAGKTIKGVAMRSKDWSFVATKRNNITGGDGDDFLFSTSMATLTGGKGNDVLMVATSKAYSTDKAGSTLSGGDGDDLMIMGAYLSGATSTGNFLKETAPPTVKDWSQHGREQFLTARADLAGKERALLQREDIAARGKTRLLAVLRMESLAAENKLDGFRHRVDHNGAVIFTLAGGGVIRDEGKELFFSARDAAARHIALAYAQKKWGKGIRLEGNRLCREPEREKEREKEQRRGMER